MFGKVKRDRGKCYYCEGRHLVNCIICSKPLCSECEKDIEAGGNMVFFCPDHYDAEGASNGKIIPIY